MNLAPPGIKKMENKIMYTIPENAIGTPNFPKSNRPILDTSSSGYLFCSKPTTTKFVEVPINVQVPPRILAKLSGINNCCGLTPIFFPHRCTIGIITTTTGVLFKNALMKAIGIINFNCAAAVLFGLPNNLPMYQSNAPVCEIPAATTNNTSTVNNPSLANPATPSSTVIILDAMSNVTADIMTWSAPIRSEISAANIRKSTIDT
mmetsp:Transcript_688/g.968  ORF Transcript_688/g.968 Transcript_688/m.968 type:complete len:205 (-) Transcript_688:412-1026(-)